MNLDPRILEAANETRAWAEKRPIFSNDKTLAGLCAISTVHLFRRLSDIGIKSEIHFGDCHVFLVVDGIVVDVTATQFADEDPAFWPNRIFVKPHEEVKSLRIGHAMFPLMPWKTMNVYTNVNDLLVMIQGWPTNQLPEDPDFEN